MGRPRAWLGLLVCTLLACGLGCSAGGAPGQDPPPSLYAEKITVGCVVWPGYTCLYVADGEGYFAEEGLDVDIKLYAGTSELSRDYVAGKMQGRANLTLEVVHEYREGMRHRVVAAIDFSDGADAIMSTTEITSVDQFKGKRVAFEPDSLEEFFLRWALQEHGLTMDDIRPIRTDDPKGSAAALERGLADVAVTYEPLVSRLEASSGFHRVYTSSDAPGLLTDVLTFNADFVERHPETIEAFLRAYFRAYRLWQADPDRANRHVAEVLNAPLDEIPQQQQGANILSFHENREAFSFASGLTSLYGNLRRIQEFVQETEGLGSPAELVGTDQLVEPRFIRALAPEFED